jgi:hypothetical protein
MSILKILIYVVITSHKREPSDEFPDVHRIAYFICGQDWNSGGEWLLNRREMVPLPLLVPGVGSATDVNLLLAAHNLAVLTHLLESGFHFHRMRKIYKNIINTSLCSYGNILFNE